jgi:hypothetical protein
MVTEILNEHAQESSNKLSALSSLAGLLQKTQNLTIPGDPSWGTANKTKKKKEEDAGSVAVEWSEGSIFLEESKKNEKKSEEYKKKSETQRKEAENLVNDGFSADSTQVRVKIINALGNEINALTQKIASLEKKNQHYDFEEAGGKDNTALIETNKKEITRLMEETWKKTKEWTTEKAEYTADKNRKIQLNVKKEWTPVLVPLTLEINHKNKWYGIPFTRLSPDEQDLVSNTITTSNKLKEIFTNTPGGTVYLDIQGEGAEKKVTINSYAPAPKTSS